ncbi:hypothetical protein NOR_06794 [Metarhizium rileyi]|uniref:Uncharacterized protein n=1 Tax=Metarhizium rileyi (strain RCEF 4871) TaxID=1649241 RepID=A0A166ZLX1_METRR|nr:hypothetical protein NOR_06794 [Metarhizium rileyi RCEF 4871]
MLSAGFLLIVCGTLAVFATSVTICLDIMACVYVAEQSKLLIASSIAVAFESTLLLMLGAVGIAQILRAKGPISWTCSLPVFITQLFAWLAALAASTTTLVFLHEWWMSTKQDDDAAAADRWEMLFVGSTTAGAAATLLQLAFIISHFVSNRDAAVGTASSFHSNEEGRRMNIKSIRYSRTLIGAAIHEKASVKCDEISPSSPAADSATGPINFLKVSVSQAIRPSSSRTKLLGSGRRRPTSLESESPRKSTDTSFDSWDTSSVDAHNRQVVIEMSSPTTVKRSLETIPASPSESRSPTRPGTPLDMELEPPRMLYRAESYSSSILSRQDSNRLTPDSSVNELHIHPLFRSHSPTPPPAASPGTIVLAAPNAGQVISRKASLQSIKRLRSGSLPLIHSPLVPQTSFDSLRQSKMRDDGDIGRRSYGAQSERKMTPPIPEWLLSPSMKASLESFKEQKQSQDEEIKEGGGE